MTAPNTRALNGAYASVFSKARCAVTDSQSAKMRTALTSSCRRDVRTRRHPGCAARVAAVVSRMEVASAAGRSGLRVREMSSVTGAMAAFTFFFMFVLDRSYAWACSDAAAGNVYEKQM